MVSLESPFTFPNQFFNNVTITSDLFSESYLKTMLTYNLIESRRNELITAINNIEKFYVLCVENNCLSDVLRYNTIVVVKEIEEVVTFMATKCYTIESSFNRKLVYDRFLEDAQELLREMSIAVSECF